MSDIIKQRDFVRRFSGYLKQTGEFTIEGKSDKYLVTIVSLNSMLADEFSKRDILPDKLIVKPGSFEEDDKLSRQAFHGCGCPKTGALCSKHGRL